MFVRTKIDKTTTEDAKKFPRTFCEQRLVRSIRERCEESIKQAKLPMNKTFVISTEFPDKWDYRALVQGKLRIVVTLFNLPKSAWRRAVKVEETFSQFEFAATDASFDQ